ncbi:MAG: MBL fold metallo-hydrolase, partial [Lachnospiraceae bacterium]|nr:MBL fold metallo-hydrolase [Lachnospiraceae bacterium]
MSFLWHLKDEVDRYWGVGALGLLFAAFCLFFLLNKEKSREMRTYLWYAFFILFAVMNPVSLYLIDKTNNLDVYERFFWLLLSPVILALGFATITGKRRGMVVPCILLILFCGRIVFTDTEYKPATHAYKIDSQAIEVNDIIIRHYEGLSEEETVIPNRVGYEGPSAMVTDPLCEQIRMYNANIRLLYVRKDFGSYNMKKYNMAAKMLSLENEEVGLKYITKKMYKRNFSYLVLGDWQYFTGNIEKYPLFEIGSTENYKVYYYDRNYVKPGTWRVTQYPDPEGYQAMCYTIESSDGGLIVIDGGRAWNSLDLVDVIKEKGGRVDYWIITHPHDDHAGVLASVLEAAWDRSEIEIGEILIGEWDEEAVLAQGGPRTDFFEYLFRGLKARGNVRYLKAGDSLEVLGLRMDVLHTCNETVTTHSDNILNDGSMVFKLSAKKRSFLFLGDIGDNSRDTAEKWKEQGGIPEATRLIADEIMSRYGDLLPSTYVQMAHHGNSTLPDEFYEAVHPKRAYFDAPKWLMENTDKETG